MVASSWKNCTCELTKNYQNMRATDLTRVDSNFRPQTQQNCPATEIQLPQKSDEASTIAKEGHPLGL